MNQSATGSEVKLGLIPDIKPLMDLHIRDTVIRIGADGMYYLTGFRRRQYLGPRRRH